MEELKTCPFCESEMYSEFYSERKDEFDGHCTNKKCILSTHTLFINTKSWNTRPREEALRSRITELEDVLKKYANHENWYELEFGWEYAEKVLYPNKES